MILSTSKCLLIFCLLASLASCRSEQMVFQVIAPVEQQAAVVNKPSVVAYEARVTNTHDQATPQRKSPRAAKPNKRQQVTDKKPLVHAVAIAKQIVRPRLISKHNTAAVRDEGEGRPALLVLGILLVLAGIAGGFLIGGGIGFFVGLPIGLLGYYFFMKGLLGPNAWIEVGNELFQL